jgi:hypothetical protein
MSTHARGATTFPSMTLPTGSASATARPLARDVRRALRRDRSPAPLAGWLVASIAGIAAATAVASAAESAFAPPVIRAGDGTEGFVADGDGEYDGAGASVSAAGDVNGDGIGDLLIGATEADPANRFQAGVTYVLFGRDTALVGEFPPLYPLGSLLPRGGGDGSEGFVLAGVDGNDNSGQAVSDAGDVNGDGIGDLLVSTPYAGRSNGGQAYLVFGRASGFSPLTDLRSLFPFGGGDGSAGVAFVGIHEFGRTGYSVSGAGDINGDGLDDLVIGAVRNNSSGTESPGESYVVFGRASGFPPVFSVSNLFPAGGGDGSDGFVIRGRDVFDSLGASVSNAGDVNGDGLADLVVGAPGAGDRVGEAYVVFGRTSGFSAVLPVGQLIAGDGSEGFVLRGGEGVNYTGRSVSGAGDVNGDGIDDLLVGAPGHPFFEGHPGETYVVFGRTTGFPAVFPLASLYPAGGGDGGEGFVLVGTEDEDHVGFALSGTGDINGDGVDDILVGAYGVEPQGRERAGQSYLVFGRTTGFPAVFPLSELFPGAGGDGSEGVVMNGAEDDWGGFSVSGAGDVNADGLADLIIGGSSILALNETEGYVVFGRTMGFPAVFELTSLLPP